METIEKVDTALRSLNLNNPWIELTFNEQNHLIGYVCSDSFTDQDDELAQKQIWAAIRKHLEKKELSQIIGIFHETPKERYKRLYGGVVKDIKYANYFFHDTPDMTRYWFFIDVWKIADDYRTLVIIINERTGFKYSMIYNYPANVISFMELKQEEIVYELFKSTYNIGEAEVKMQIMFKHDELSNKGVPWNENYFNYVYDSFSFRNASKQTLIFSEKECSLLDKIIKKAEKTTVICILKQSIDNSREILKTNEKI